MLTYVLLVHPQLAFAVSMKQALERTGNYEVHPFTSPQLALNYLDGHPQDIAILDLGMPDGAGAFIDAVRAVQPQIAIVVTPRQPDLVISTLRLQGTLNAPFTAREIIPIIQRGMEGRRGSVRSKGATVSSGEEIGDEDHPVTGLLTRLMAEDSPQPARTKPAPTRAKPSSKNDEQRIQEPPVAEGSTPSLPIPAMDAGGGLQWDFAIDGSADAADDQAPPREPPRVFGLFTDADGALENEIGDTPADFDAWDERSAGASIWDNTPGAVVPSLFDDIQFDEPAVLDGDPLDSIAFNDYDSDADSAYSGSSRRVDTSDDPDQFSANAFEPDVFGAGEFNAVLDSIQGQVPDTNKLNEFDTLVDTMRVPEDRPSLAKRTARNDAVSGMDDLIGEIQRTRTDRLAGDPINDAPTRIDLSPTTRALDDQDSPVTRRTTIHDAPTSLQNRLSREEPPMPSFEESGTVHDLMKGVHEAEFERVLASLLGDDIPEDDDPPVDPSRVTTVTEADIEALFALTLPSSRIDTDELDALFNEVENRTVESKPAGSRRPPPTTLPEAVAEDDSPAKTILAQTSEPSALDSFSISELINSIEQQLPAHRPNVLPLPSWVEQGIANRELRAASEEREPPQKLPEMNRYAAPDKLPEENSFTFDSVEGAAYDQTTMASQAERDRIASAPDELETAWMAVTPGEGNDPFSADAFELTPSEAVLDFDSLLLDIDGSSDEAREESGNDARLDTFEAEDELLETPTFARDWVDLDVFTDSEVAKERFEGEIVGGDTQPLDALEDDAPYLPTHEMMEEDAQPSYAAQAIDDPYITQLALSLTEVSLELTAEAILLTRDNTIIAFAGRMAGETIEEMAGALDGRWDAPSEQALIRFIPLASLAKDYMLYSRRTENDLTLSLIFSGQTPLRDIRRQEKRLIEALRAVPEPMLENELPLDDEPVSEETLALMEDIDRAPYTYVWLLRDASAVLPPNTVRAMIEGMERQLRKQAWRVGTIQASDEYIYVEAEVPTTVETPPYEIVRDLKRRAAEIVRRQNPTLDPATLWADSYLIVTPGRPLEADEIQQFIQFERML